MIHWLKREELMPKAIEKINPVLIGLDIGVGIVSHKYLKSVVYICSEPYQEYVDVLKSKISIDNDRVYVIQKKDWYESVCNLEEKSIDSVYLIDVIEHLTKEEGVKLLEMTEKVVRNQIVLFTPLGFVRQEVLDGGKDAWGLNGAEYQEHKSGWMPEDFDETWDIYACKDFHNLNNIGEKLEKPFGAFWAIKNLNRQNELSEFSFDSLSYEIKKALVDELPHKYFEIIESFENEKIQNQQMKSEYEKLKTEFPELQIKYENLQNINNQVNAELEWLKNTVAVRLVNKIKKLLKKIGIMKNIGK